MQCHRRQQHGIEQREHVRVAQTRYTSRHHNRREAERLAWNGKQPLRQRLQTERSHLRARLFFESMRGVKIRVVRCAHAVR